MKALSIAQKIYGSFGALVILIAAVCIAGYLGVAGVSRTFVDYRQTAQQTLAVSGLVEEMDRLRLTESEFRLNYAAEVAQRFADEIASLSLNSPQTAAMFAGDAAETEALGRMQEGVAAFAKGFATLSDMHNQRQAMLASMTEKATASRELVGKIADVAANTLYDMTMMGETAELNSSLLSMLAAAERYFLTGTEDDFAKVTKLGTEVTEQVNGLVDTIGQPDPKQQAQTVAQLMAEYAAMADQLKQLVDQQKDLETNTLDAVGGSLHTELASMQARIVDRQNRLGPEGERQVGSTLLVLVVAGAIAIAVGIAAALLMGGSLSRAIRGMSQSMRRLAEGDLDAELASTHRGQELGQMAEALEVFRTNGLAVRNMDQQKAAQAEAEARQREDLEAMQRDVERVVSSALDGNFSARVGAQIVDADASGFARSLNEVMMTVERGVGETADVLDSFARSDLSRRMTGDFAGAFGRLKVSANAAADNFADVVRQLQGASRELKMATGEILAGANDLSERTTKQAATIAETSSAIEQLQRAVSENASKTNEVAKQTQLASGMADEGGHVMQKATAAMERITQSSTKISNIIGLIDDVAFQTNLLALNASVEAARAGEAGKGFAVVAIEVRRLAQSAAQASAEVKELVEASANEVRGGSHLVDEAAAKLAAILKAVRENSALVGGISSATQEQAAAISEVSVAIRRMDEMTQHNAALVEETNASIEQTEGQARELDRIADTFTLAREATAPEPAQRPARPAPEPVPRPAKPGPQRARPQLRSAGNAAISSDWAEF